MKKRISIVVIYSICVSILYLHKLFDGLHDRQDVFMQLVFIFFRLLYRMCKLYSLWSKQKGKIGFDCLKVNINSQMREMRRHRNIFSQHQRFLNWMSDFSVSLKGIVSRDEYFLKAQNNKLVLSVHALVVFTFFCILVDEIIKLKVVACSFEII
jgi:hypothetical protein